MPLISVIMPVYNTGRYLERSLRSVLSQDLRDIEVICIDDCSSDESPRILAEMKSSDDRLKVITSPVNKGAAASRNAGIEAAEGEWICFLDSDDWIDQGYLSAMYSKALESGSGIMVNSGIMLETDTPGVGQKGEVYKYSDLKEGYVSPKEIQPYFIASVWARLFKRSFIEENELRFPEHLRCAEDIWFTTLCALLADKVYMFKGPLYHYARREGSLTYRYDISRQEILSDIALFHEIKRRNLSAEDIKLLHVNYHFSIEDEAFFDILKSYFVEIEDIFRRNYKCHTVIDIAVFDAVMSSPDYSSFRRKYGTCVAAHILRNRIGRSL